LKQIPDFIEKYYFLPKLLNVESKYPRYQYCVKQVNSSVALHLRYSNKQQLILTKFYTNNAPFIGNQNAKF